MLAQAITDTLGDGHHHSVGTLARDADDTLTFHANLNATHTSRPPQTAHPPEPHSAVPTTPWQHTRHWVDVRLRASLRDWWPRCGFDHRDRLDGRHPGRVVLRADVAGQPWQPMWTRRVRHGW